MTDRKESASAMAEPRSDLHVHSDASDGALSPADLVGRAAEAGLAVLGLTDHDTLDGIEPAVAAAGRHGLTLVPGVEISSEWDGREAHVLGYFVDPSHRPLRARLEEQRRKREHRGRDTVELLARLGYPLSWPRVQELAGEGNVGRPHVARALIEAGHACDIADAFARFLGEGAPAYIAAPVVDPVEAVALVLAAGGLPVLAHPLRLLDALPHLVGAGLAGIEVYYAAYSDGEVALLAATAEGAGLLRTGGSDFHGLAHSEGRLLGSGAIPWRHVERLLAHGRRR